MYIGLKFKICTKLYQYIVNLRLLQINLKNKISNFEKNSISNFEKKRI